MERFPFFPSFFQYFKQVKLIASDSYINKIEFHSYTCTLFSFNIYFVNFFLLDFSLFHPPYSLPHSFFAICIIPKNINNDDTLSMLRLRWKRSWNEKKKDIHLWVKNIKTGWKWKIVKEKIYCNYEWTSSMTFVQVIFKNSKSSFCLDDTQDIATSQIKN